MNIVNIGAKFFVMYSDATRICIPSVSGSALCVQHDTSRAT